MAHSMTGYASQDVSLTGGTARWEIRSVNHRYLELSFKLPSQFSELEFSLRELAKKKLHRGKVDCFLRVDLLEAAEMDLSINLELADKLMNAHTQISERFKLQGTASGFDVLNWPLVLQTSQRDLSALKAPLQQSFEIALQHLIETRAREGEKLKACILERVYKMHTLIEGVNSRLPEIEQAYKAKFAKRILELKLEIGTDRFEPSMTSLIQKMDITEELDRLKMHLTEVNRILTEDELMGRRLDFLMQELNREANTLGSKAMEGVTVQDGVQLKVLIEEMREQIQNIE